MLDLQVNWLVKLFCLCFNSSRMQRGLQEGTATQTEKKPQHTAQRFLRRILHQKSRKQWDLSFQAPPPRCIPKRTEPVAPAKWREPHWRPWRWTCLHWDGWNWCGGTRTFEKWRWGARRVCVWGDEVPSSRWYGVPHRPRGMSLSMPHPGTLRPWAPQPLLHPSKHPLLWHSRTLSQSTHSSTSAAGLPTSTSSVLP